MDAMRVSFSGSDQTAFAALSGDWNPVHVDPVVARRLLFGAQVVHGVHLICLAMDRAARAGALGRPVTALRAQFLRPVLIDTAAELTREKTAEGLRLTIAVDGMCATVIDLGFGEEWPQAEVKDNTPDRGTPVVRTLQASLGASGALPLAIPMTEFDERFPALRSALGTGLVAALLASTRLVGMECPGLHSIYHDLRLTAQPGAARSRQLAWEATSARAPLKMIEMAVNAGQIAGGIRAFFRPEAISQLSMKEAREIVAGKDAAPVPPLTGRHALVIGGSRGLGEVAAKLYAAAGADVTLTYARGAEDARRVAGEIADAGAACRSARFDVLDPEAALPGGTFTDMAYFASPRIAARAAKRFDEALFQDFAAYFVTAFHRVCAGLPGPISVFYPSTVFLSEHERNFREYVAAKGAGEALARQVPQDLPGRAVHIARLPRMHTDQTAALHGAQGAAPGPVLWPHLLRAIGPSE